MGYGGGGGGGSGGSGGSSSGYGAGYGSSGDGDAYIENPPLQPTPVGAIRFNTDSSKLEYYDGNQWQNITSTSPEVQTGGGRGVFGTGVGGSTIDYINIATTGNAIDFGNYYDDTYETSSASSRTRGVMMGGNDPSPSTRVNTCAYITIASTGDSTDFGDLTQERGHSAGCSNQTRGLCAGGQINPDGSSLSNVIDYITIAQTGNAVDFGDLVATTAFMGTGRNNTTRAVFVAGMTPTATNVMQYVTISTLGNTADFGDSLEDDYGQGAGNASNAVRSILSGANVSGGSPVNTISYFSCTTLGNSKDFGDLGTVRRGQGAVASGTRAVFAGGRTPSDVNIIDYVQIMSTGNAIDFGDLTVTKSFNNAGMSNSHGGLG